MGKIATIANRIAFSERNQLLQAIPQFHVERILHHRTPITRCDSQRNERSWGLRGPNSVHVFRGRTLAIRIAAITVTRERSQKFKVMKFEIFRVRNVVDFRCQIFSRILPGKKA